MGLMSLDMMNLRILEKGDDIKKAKYASRIIPVVEKHHLLLVFVASYPLHFICYVGNIVTLQCCGYGSITNILGQDY
jgi:hypothetical protein